MSLKVGKTQLVQYILIIMLYLWHYSGLILAMGTANFYYFILITCAVVMLWRKKTIQNKAFLFVGVLAANVILVRFLSGGVGIAVIIKWASAIFLTYTAVYIDRKKFIERFVKIVAIFAVFSILMWIITLTLPNLFIATSLYTYVPFSTKYWLNGQTYHLIPTTYYGNLFYVMRIGNELTRNNGIFNEPGLYQIVLNTALFALVFYEDSVQIDEKTKNKLLVIIVIAIITCQSTSGYIGMVVIFMGALLLSDRQRRNKIFGSVILIAMVVAIDYVVNGNESLVMTTIGYKLFASNKGFELNGSSFARVETMEIAFNNIMKNPFGAGFDRFNQLIAAAGKNSSDGAGLFAYLIALGIEIWVIIYFFVIHPMIKNHRSVVVSMVAIFLYINTVSGQSDIFYPALLILALPIWKELFTNNQDNTER